MHRLGRLGGAIASIGGPLPTLLLTARLRSKAARSTQILSNFESVSMFNRRPNVARFKRWILQY